MKVLGWAHSGPLTNMNGIFTQMYTETIGSEEEGGHLQLQEKEQLVLGPPFPITVGSNFIGFRNTQIKQDGV